MYTGSSLPSIGVRMKRTDSFLTLMSARRVLVGSFVCGAEYGNWYNAHNVSIKFDMA